MPEAFDEELEPLEAPCRAAARQLVDCEICGRRLQLKTYRYSHVCRRSFDVQERAAEQAQLATAAFRQRTQSKKKAQPDYATAFASAFQR